MKLKAADFEALGEGIADDNGIAMAAVGRNISASTGSFPPNWCGVPGVVE